MGKPRSISVKDGRDNISLADTMGCRVYDGQIEEFIFISRTIWKKSWSHISEGRPGLQKI
jgi:hypothetical protein